MNKQEWTVFVGGEKKFQVRSKLCEGLDDVIKFANDFEKLCRDKGSSDPKPWCAFNANTNEWRGHDDLIRYWRERISSTRWSHVASAEPMIYLHLSGSQMAGRELPYELPGRCPGCGYLSVYRCDIEDCYRCISCDDDRVSHLTYGQLHAFWERYTGSDK